MAGEKKFTVKIEGQRSESASDEQNLDPTQTTSFGDGQQPALSSEDARILSEAIEGLSSIEFSQTDTGSTVQSSAFDLSKAVSQITLDDITNTLPGIKERNGTDETLVVKLTQTLEEGFAEIAKTLGEAKEKEDKTSTPTKADQGPISVFIQKALRPILQSGFTTTLLRNNAERTATELAQQVTKRSASFAFSKKGNKAQTRVVVSFLRLGGVTKGLSRKLTNLVLVAGKVTGGFLAIVGVVTLAATAVVGLAKTISKSTTQFARNLARFDTRIQTAVGLNQLRNRLNNELRGIRVGERLSDQEISNQRFREEFSEFSDNLFNIAQPLLETVVESGTFVLQLVNFFIQGEYEENEEARKNALEEQLRNLNKIMEKLVEKQVTSNGRFAGLGPLALELASIVDSKAREGLREQLDEIKKTPPSPPAFKFAPLSPIPM